MSRYDTGNPLGSDSPLDRSDNTKNLDLGVNDRVNKTFTDRQGVPRKTWHGMEREFDQAQQQRQTAFNSEEDLRKQRFNEFIASSGYERVADYAAGITIDEYNQGVVDANGEFWRIAFGATLPYTTTGDGLPEDGAFVFIGQDELRQNLEQGTALVGSATGVQLLADALNSRLTGVGDIQSLKALAPSTAVSGAVKNVLSDQYVWAPNSTLPDNGNNVVAPSGNPTAGRWVSAESAHAQAVNKSNIRAPAPLVLSGTWGERPINIMGDSISHGNGANDIANNSWVGILKKAMAAEWGFNNYGFCSLRNILGDGSTELHSVSFSGTWTNLSSNAAARFVNGRAYQNTAAGDYVEIAVPSSYSRFNVFYDGGTSATISVTVNGDPGGTIDCNEGLPGAAQSQKFGIVDNGTGSCIIRLTVTAGTVAIMGLGYYNSIIGYPNVVHNLSDGGRTGRTVGQSAIEAAMRGASLFIWALGTNDDSFDSSSSEADNYRQRINWILEYAQQFGTKVMFLELNFGVERTNYVRKRIAEAAFENPDVILLRLPDYVDPRGRTETTQALTDRGFLSDNLHPSEIGHRVIFEAVASALGLASKSKYMAVANDKLWTPAELQSGFTNINSTPSAITAYRYNGNTIDVRIRVDTNGATGGETLFTIPYAIASGCRYSVVAEVTGIQEASLGFEVSGNTTAVVYRSVPNALPSIIFAATLPTSGTETQGGFN